VDPSGTRLAGLTVNDSGYQFTLSDAELALGHGAIWALSGNENIARIDPATGGITAVVSYHSFDPTYAFTGGPFIEVGQGSLWLLADLGHTQVLRISLRTGQPLGRIRVGGSCGQPCSQIYDAAGAVWVPSGSDIVRIVVDLRASRAALVVDARLASAQAPPCAAGESARSVSLDEQRRWDRPVGVTGAHAMELFFDGAASLLGRADAVLDVSVGDPATSARTCLRVPLGADPEAGTAVLAPARAWSVGGVLRGGVPTTRAPARFLDDELRFTRWLGPAALGLEAGWSVQGCVTRCPLVPGIEFPVWALVEVVPARAHGLALGLEAAYGVTLGTASGVDEVLHGPRVALHLLELPPPVWGARARTTGRGLEISLSHQRSAAGPIAPVWLVGIGWVTF